MANFPIYNAIGGQQNYRSEMYTALPGGLSGMSVATSCRIAAHMNDVGAVDIYTLTPPGTPTASTTYTVTINGVAVSYTTDSSATAAELSAGIMNAIMMTPTVYRLVDVAVDGSNVITLTGQVLGVALSVVAPGFTVANATPAARYGVLPFGRFVGRKTTYKLDPRENVSSATLVDAASGYEVLGVTVRSSYSEQVGTFESAREGYDFGRSFNVLEDSGTLRGIWVECVESDLKQGDTAYISVAAGHEGKLSKTSSGNVNISAKAKIVSAAEMTIGNRLIALVTFDRYR